MVVIRFTSDGQTALPLTSVASPSVTMTVEGQTLPVAYATTAYEIYFGLNQLSTYKHGTLVTLHVTHDSNTEDRYFRLVHRFSPYGLGNTESYFWVPLALFSTDFKSSENGITLASMPVGLAVGGRLYFDNGFYLGGSAVASWLIFKNQGPAEGYNVQSAAIGAVIDVNNYVFVGTAYGLDFRAGATHPGLMFVVGPGPSLLQVFKSTPH
ncbi:Hypothetical protein AA314_09163 [Archangium gephyra]|uniref:Uncharacterized protein n=1 Tax=Archangium gephyra TaxID=48 RepID=A0AAC8QGX1_9BACT|nr:Hypothetical protein AA314_09163 [Archangium gephyra]